jgi:hypothetical protein
LGEASIATSQRAGLQVFISSASLSTAWARAFSGCVANSSSEVAPLIVDLVGFDGTPSEDPRVRALADKWLVETNGKAIDTTASLIFPERSWLYHRDAGSKSFFQYYRETYFPRLKEASPLNARGTYFHRMVSYGPGGIDQLDQLLDAYKSGLRRRSAFQLVIFDPSRDHSLSKRLGFPCLDYVAFSPNKDGSLSMTAMYAMQYVHDRAYGNYLGLCALGRFIASELDLRFCRLTSIAAVARLGSLNRGRAREMASELSILMPEIASPSIVEEVVGV